MKTAAFRFEQQGFTLIEVMVAFLVLAIGLLGVMGLQNTAIRSNFNSSSQMQALLLAQEMADLVRASPAAMAARSYNGVAGANNTACTSATGCTTAQMAAFDKYLWDKRVQENLGSDATGVVCIDSTPTDGIATSVACDGSGSAWVVKLWWTEGSTEGQLVSSSQTVSTADLIYRDDTQNAPSLYVSFQP